MFSLTSYTLPLHSVLGFIRGFKHNFMIIELETLANKLAFTFIILSKDYLCGKMSTA